jgi:hypothetical protein
MRYGGIIGEKISTYSGVWDLRRQELEQLSSNWAIPPPPSYSGTSQGGGAGTTLNIPALTSTQMVLLMERTDSSTPRATVSGFTSIITSNNSSRSMRMQYRIGGAAEDITMTNGGVFIVINNVTGVGVSNNYDGGTSSSTTIQTPSLSGISSSGKSMLFATHYAGWGVTAIQSPFTLISSIGGYIEQFSSTSISQYNMTNSFNAYIISAIVEII